MTISIDGGPETDIDLYNSLRNGKQIVFESSDLLNVTHKIILKCSGRKNLNSTGIAAFIDGIFILNNNSAGLFDIEQSSYSFSENVSVISFNILRKGGTAGKVEVNYGTFPGSAINGVNYQPWSGTLSFNDGENLKKVNITIINTKSITTPLNFTLQLSNPLMPSTLGFITTATINLLSNSAAVLVKQNLALNKTAVSSSNETSNLTPNYVTDGLSSTTSRWSSGVFTNGQQQWIYVDLGQLMQFDTIKIYWETANASIYRIEVSNDATKWNSIYRTTVGTGGIETITLTVSQIARYVRVYCEQNNASAAPKVSIYEIEIYNFNGTMLNYSLVNATLNNGAILVSSTNNTFVGAIGDAGGIAVLTITVPTARSYNLGVQYLSGDVNRKFMIDINGAYTGTIYNVNKTTDWTIANSQTINTNINLNSGANTVKFYNNPNSPAPWIGNLIIIPITLVSNTTTPTVSFVNLALNKQAFSLANETASLTPNLITDGDVSSLNSRWSSGNFNTGQQWIYIDLSQTTQFDNIRIYWEDANATIYRIEISNDATNWVPVYRTTLGRGGVENISLISKQNARYVRVFCEQNNTKIWTSVSIFEIEIYNGAPPEIIPVNLALNKQAFSSANETASLTPNLVTDGNTSSLTSRWSSGNFNTGQQWVYIDLNEITQFDTVKIYWEVANAIIYRIEVSNDETNWISVYRTTTGQGAIETISLASKQNARYVRLFCEQNNISIWTSVSIYEIKIYNNNYSSTQYYQTSSVDLALNRQAISSANETTSLTPNYVTDGVTNSESLRWSSGNFNIGQQWVYIDLSQQTQFDTVRIFWEGANATIYRIEVSNDATNWTSVYRTTTGAGGIETISLTSKQTARYVRIFCEKNNPAVWTSVSIFEIQIFNGMPQDVVSVVNGINNLSLNARNAKLNLSVSPVGFNIQLINSNFTTVINQQSNIYFPLTDMSVSTLIKVSDVNGNSVLKEFPITVPGLYPSSIGNNVKPDVIPNIREWLPGNGTFTPSSTSRIVLDINHSNELNNLATKFKNDYKIITSIDIPIIVDIPKAGDFYFTLSCKDRGLGIEGYYIYINDYVKIESISKVGAFYSTRTILQIIKQYNNKIVKGTIRDYPKYECRGFMLDVGRKFFTMDFLKQYLEVMAWYKMNEIQLHINDNTIGVNETTWQTDYQAFRLESTTYPGLTATDGYYTKNDYKNFVSLASDYGIKVITEIDTPAHSLCFTRYNTSLALGTGSGRDHLNVQNSDTYTFVDNLFKEYLTGPSPVIGNNEFHIGTDEYFGTQAQLESFRGYTDNYLKQVRDSYKITPRLWGSLSQIQGKTPITSSGVTMNIWNLGWADANAMINAGYNIINSEDSDLYIVPLAGYYRDYLDAQNLFNNWNANNFGSYSISQSHPQLRGAMFAIWNDKIGRVANGISELDVYDRLLPATQVLGEKLWGGTTSRTFTNFSNLVIQLSTVPNSNLRYNIKSLTNVIVKYSFEDTSISNIADASGNNYNGSGANINFVSGKVGNAVKLNGGASYIQTPVDNKGPNYTITMWVNKTANGDYSEQILSESSIGVFKATQITTGNVGFSREGYNYSFKYKLPENQWVKLALVAQLQQTQLYVNDILTDTINYQNGGLAGTFIFPLSRLGSSTKAFKGSIDEFIIQSS